MTGTFLLVDFAWIFFASSSLRSAVSILAQMFRKFSTVGIYSIGLSKHFASDDSRSTARTKNTCIQSVQSTSMHSAMDSLCIFDLEYYLIWHLWQSI